MSSRQALSTMVPSLSDKFKSSDSDIRVMALLDLNKELVRVIALPPPPTSAYNRGPDVYADETSEKLLTNRVLELLADSNAEVKNAAVACLANMSKRARSTYLSQIVRTITDGIGLPGQDIDEEKRDISCLALKSVVAEMNPEADQVVSCLDTIIQRVRKNVCQPSAHPHLASELLQIQTDIYTRFPAIVAESAELQEASLATFREVFAIPRLSIRKRAVPTLAAFIAVCPQQFETLKADMAKGLAQGGDSAKAWVAATAGMAKSSAASDVGGLISGTNLIGDIMSQASDLDDSDAVEGAMTALEVLVLRCPSEISPYVSQITTRALELVKYDPNYVEMSDDEDDVDMDDEDDDDDFDNDVYSDDDDDSWKIRRSAAKLLSALFSTRPDLLLEFYKTAAPLLVNRFSEREESVRLEVLAAFEALLKQTANVRTADLAASGRNKRKRSEEMDEDASSEDSAMRALHEILPQLVKAILKQTSAKTVATRQQSFVLLRQIVEALDGGLESEADAVCSAAEDALRSSDQSTPSLTIAVLSFLTEFFTHHLARNYTSHLTNLTRVIVRCMRDKLQRINFEAFAAASALAQAIRPVSRGSASPLRSGFDQPVQEIFKQTTSVLGDSSVDGDVREKALITLGDLLVHEGDVLTKELPTALQLIASRLEHENTASTAVDVIGRVAESNLCEGAAFDAWLIEMLSAVVVSIRRNKRSLSKATEFSTLESILNRVGKSLPADIASGIVVELKPFVELPAALQIVARILGYQPASRATVQEHILPEVLNLIKTSGNSALVDEFDEFFGQYVDGDANCALDLVPGLVQNLSSTSSIPDATLGGTLAYSTTSRVIGTVVQHSLGNLAGILGVFQRVIKSSKAPESDLYLALLSIGEIGRYADLSSDTSLLERVLRFFTHSSEEVRSAAAFAAGNMAVGSPNTYLPALVQQFQTTKDEPTRLLLLYSFKEVILHSATAQLESLIDTLWEPLFGEGTGETQGDDGVRNVKAACIGKLTIASPNRFLPQLQKMLQGSSQQRALVAASIRYTFIDSTSSYDELIAPIIGDFLSLMEDENLIVRRLAVAALNAAAQNKPQLIIDKLAALQPALYQETEVKKELQREVQMGPWKVIEDDGLENRKTALETMYTLLATCFGKLDIPTFAERVLAALRDVNEVKVLGLMLLLRLAQLQPSAVLPRLGEVAESMQAIMKDVDVKEDTVKSDLERKEEMQRSALRTAVPIYRMSSAAQAPAFHQFVAGLLKMDQWKEYRDYTA